MTNKIFQVVLGAEENGEYVQNKRTLSVMALDAVEAINKAGAHLQEGEHVEAVNGQETDIIL